MTIEQEVTSIMRRVEDCATQAQMNAQNDGGDDATAAADLMCAFVLLSAKSGVDPERDLAEIWVNAKATVAAFWPADAMIHQRGATS